MKNISYYSLSDSELESLLEATQSSFRSIPAEEMLRLHKEKVEITALEKMILERDGIVAEICRRKERR